MESSSTLLARATSLWVTGRKASRDNMIEVGRILHKFILARMQEGNGKNEKERSDLHINRAFVVEEAATQLGVSNARINELVRTAAVVDLLGEGEDLGCLSYRSITWFRRVVRRKGQGKGKVGRGRKLGSGELTVSSWEEWEVRTPCKDWAVDLFKKAIREGWTTQQVVDELNSYLGRGRSNGSNPLDHRHKNSTPLCTLRSMVNGIDVKDAAEMIVELVLTHTNPSGLAALVESKLFDAISSRNRKTR